MRGRSPTLTAMAIAMLSAAMGCADTYHPEYHPVSSYTVNQSVSYPTIYQVPGGSGAATSSDPATPEPAPTPNAAVESEPPGIDPSHVIVVESSRLDRPAEVVAVLDMQDSRGTHDSGIALLRERAAQLGADAVVSVEFHPGEGGRPAHASGLAVRFDRRGR